MPQRDARSPAPSKRREHARDPVVLALMQNRLDQISRHMGWVMTRTARSPIFSQSHDFSCFITDPDGTLDRQRRRHPDPHRWRRVRRAGAAQGLRRADPPEDVFILSDPYVAGGNHLPDWVIARPICRRSPGANRSGRLLLQPGPPVRHRRRAGRHLQPRGHRDLARGHPPAGDEAGGPGEVRDDLWELLLINSRTPELLDGDLRAMLGSTRIGAERVTALVDELGIESYFDHLDGRARPCRAAHARGGRRPARRRLLGRGPHRQRLLPEGGRRRPRGPHGGGR